MKGRKKVLIVARWPVGGIRTYFRYIYSQNMFNEYQFTFLMYNDGGVREFLKEHCPNLNFEFIDSGNSTTELFKLVRREMASGKYSLVHSHGYTAGAVTSAALLMNKKTPHLMTAHDVFLGGQFTGLKGWIKKAAMGAVFVRMDAIHAVSGDCKSNFLEFFPKVPESRVKTILHGVDTERFYNESPRDFREELELSEQFLLGFFGRFMAQKGFKYIVAAVEQLIAKDESYRERIRVLTFGWGGFIREEFEALERKGLSDIFIQMPHTDNMPAAINGVDAVLMPSLWEACGLLGMEALAAGTPIIGTNCIGLREVLEGSPALVVKPKDSRALSEAISECVSEDKRQVFKAYAETAVARFSLDLPAKSLAGLYEKMILERM